MSKERIDFMTRPQVLRILGVVPLIVFILALGWGAPAGIFRDSMWVNTAIFLAAGTALAYFWKRVCRPNPAQWGRIQGLLAIWILVVVNIVSLGVGYGQMLGDASPVFWVRDLFWWVGVFMMLFGVPLTGRLLYLLFEALGHEGPPKNSVPPPLQPYRPFILPQHPISPWFENSHLRAVRRANVRLENSLLNVHG